MRCDLLPPVLRDEAEMEWVEALARGGSTSTLILCSTCIIGIITIINIIIVIIIVVIIVLLCSTSSSVMMVVKTCAR